MSEITVVVPTRGNPVYLAEALASLAADGAAGADVIVVEDGTRRADERALGGARLIRLPHVGRSLARNAGVEAARTELVAFLDADDVSLPGRLARERALLASSRDAVLAFGRVEVIGERSEPLLDWTAEEERRFDALLARGPLFESLLADCPIYTSTTMVRREAFLAAGGYDVRLDAYEDLDLYLRLTQLGRLVPCDGAPLARHRIHRGVTSSPHLYAGALRLVEKHLPRARGRARRLLLERRVDCLWGLADFRGARIHALRALAEEPGLLAEGRFAKRLAASALPVAALRALRERRR